MTVFLSDTFNGVNASIQGRVPDVMSGPNTWNDGYLIRTNGSGALYFSGGGDTSAGGYAGTNYGTNSGSYSASSPASGVIRASFTTGPDVAPNAVGHRGFGISVSKNDNSSSESVGCEVSAGDTNGGWTLRIRNTFGSVVSTTPVIITANTTYELALAFNSTTATVRFQGADTSVSYATGSKTLSGFYISDIGTSILVNSVEISDVALPALPKLNAALTAPSPTLSGSITLSQILTAAFTAPPPTLSASVKELTVLSAELYAPRPTLSASVIGAYALSFVGGPPMGTLSAYTGAAAALSAPSPLLSAGLTATNTLNAGLTAPSPLLSASGVVPQVMRASLTAPMGSIRAFTGAVARLTAPSSPVMSASITTGNKLTATIMAPLFELTATATQRNKLDANLTAPSGYLVKGAVAQLTAPMGQLTAIGSAVISVIYEAYALNLNHKPRGNEMPADEMTHYTNFPFDRIVRYKDRYYGMSSSGLFLLGGATDDGAPIQWDVKTCMTDFSSVFLKTVTAAYFGGRLGPSATVDLHVGEAGTLTYSYTTPLGTDAQNYRQVFGKGVKDRYYALGVKGTGAFSLDSITLSVSELSRRI